ncbi:uncharacterized protein LOC134275568 isoform X2 [Saccostrea cucullata]|uniref:uncharacterized protein LOC134275568 isoform X2 n=1 Tax=Saccostrea cuccullata TaxID=36930 RepID=UPI002ED1C41F
MLPDFKRPFFGLLIGFILWIVALATPGWIVYSKEHMYDSYTKVKESTNIGIFYTVVCGSEKCEWTSQFFSILLGNHIEVKTFSVLSLVLYGVGLAIVSKQKAINGAFIVLTAESLKKKIIPEISG